jgi:hypothetical protein
MKPLMTLWKGLPYCHNLPEIFNTSRFPDLVSSSWTAGHTMHINIAMSNKLKQQKQASCVTFTSIVHPNLNLQVCGSTTKW